MSKSNSNKSYAIWGVAGVVVLVALIVGLSSTERVKGGDDVSTPGDKPTVVITQTQKPRMDAVFVIDATGSMGDEIDVVKKEVWTIANTLMSGKPTPDIRFGLVFYQDRGDSFLVKRTDLTRDVDRVHDELMAISAGGGGDWREHVGRGLHEAVSMGWDPNGGVAKMIYLVGDAPGHDDYNDGYSIRAATDMARSKGIKINVIGCSGLDSGRPEFQRIAAATSGVYRDLTYQQVVIDDTGQRRSVVYYNGDLYEADEELAKKDWARGGDVLLKEGRVRKASRKMRDKAAAPGAKTMNNLDAVVTGSMKKEAKAMGVVY